MSRGPDAATLLARALVQGAAARGLALEIVESDWCRWASATFAGARHALTVAAPAGRAVDAWLAGLPEAEFALHGHLVADVAVVRSATTGERLTAALEILTVEER